MRVLQAINWGLLCIFAVSALSWFAVCMMLIPYPQMLEENGISMTPVYARTAVFTLLACLSIMTTWLSMRRHACVWAGQTVLFLSIAGVLGWWFFS